MEWVMVLMPVGLLILGFPIFIILLATSAIILLFFMQVPLTAVHQVMFGSVDKFALMAVPFFIFAGELMGMGGISQRIIAWVMSVIGGMRGSLPLTTVGTCTIFGAISGSSPATVAAVGPADVPAAAREGLQREILDRRADLLRRHRHRHPAVDQHDPLRRVRRAVGVASVHRRHLSGPPDVADDGRLHLLVRRPPRYPRRPAPSRWSEFLRASKSGIWALGTPGIILGGIYAGVFSPTEAAGIACVYAIVVTKFIYGDISWRGIWDVSVNSMYLTAQVLIIANGAAARCRRGHHRGHARHHLYGQVRVLVPGWFPTRRRTCCTASGRLR